MRKLDAQSNMFNEEMGYPLLIVTSYNQTTFPTIIEPLLNKQNVGLQLVINYNNKLIRIGYIKETIDKFATINKFCDIKFVLNEGSETEIKRGDTEKILDALLQLR